MKTLNIYKVLALVAILGIAPIASVMAAPNAPGSDVNKLLAQLRQVTDKYHDVAAAEADGYIQASPFVPNMGYHYVDYALVSNQTPDPLKPQIILYDSKKHMVGVEYFVLYTGQPAPVLFGQTMNGPDLTEPDLPPHYDFHVYLWKGNPDGIFADYNPNVK